MEIDQSKDVYLFVHGRSDLRQKAQEALQKEGFAASKVVDASPAKAGAVGDYMAMLWMPPNPDHIKIQRITAVDESAKPEGMMGVWKGVSKDDLAEIKI